MDIGTAIGLLVLALAVGVYGSIIGAGGGFLMVAALTLIFGLSGATAVGTSSVSILFVQLSGAYTYDRKGLVDRASAKWVLLSSVPVAFVAAALLAASIPQRAFDLIVGVLLLGLAAFVLLVRTPSLPDGEVLAPRRALLTGLGTGLGLLSGGFGAGSGLVSVPALSWFQRLSAHRATATTSAIGAIGGIASVAGHVLARNPEWAFLPVIIVGAVVGGRLGASNAGRLSPRTVLMMLAAGLVVAGLPLLIRGLP